MRPHELALKTGRALQSEQTGWVHLCFEGDSRDTIPLFENGCFALALLRTRMSDEAVEGMELIKQILAFEVDGHFPVYLHEYPKVRDQMVGLRLATLFYWIRKDYSHVLGELKGQIDGALARIARAVTPDHCPDWARARLDLLAGKEIGPLAIPKWPSDFDEMLITMQMAGQTPHALAELWDKELGIFCGPGLKRFQEEGEPALHYRDLFFGAWSGQFPSRAIRGHHPTHLKGALVRPILEPFPESQPERVQFQPEAEWPLALYWGDESVTHSFVLARKHLEVSGTPNELILTLPQELPDDGDKSFEIGFFLSLHPDHSIFIEGERATTFHMGEKITIESKGMRLTLCFSADEGHFFGHLLQGNRPSQVSNKGEKHFAAFDWKIAVRTCSRPERCSVKVALHWEQMPDCPPPLPSHASHYQHIE
ncbi:MAG: hypothetical protein K940chlam2_01644 [Chlamydiae bacterium]|nr:hypothetical protein [Chlamydiota bacterium]